MLVRVTAVALSLLALAFQCSSTNEPGSPIAKGTWGGERAGAIVGDTAFHLHINCTEGNAPRPTLGMQGRFEVVGEYNVDAYPVNLGIYHPARFFGTVVGKTMKVTVELTDTRQVIGPAELELGAPPEMGNCPICDMPDREEARASR